MLRMEELVGKIQAEAKERQRGGQGGVLLRQPVAEANKEQRRDPDKGKVDQKIAEAAGVSRETVRRVRRVEENAVQPIKEEKLRCSKQRWYFRGSKVRVIKDDKGEPWFVAVDVCGVLGVLNSRDAIARLDDDEKDDVGIADAIGRMQKTSIISEPGLYKLIMLSRKPEAKPFQRWVTHEVCKSLSRTDLQGMPPFGRVSVRL